MLSPWAQPSWREELVQELKHAQPRFFIVARRDAQPITTYVNLDSEGCLRIFPELEAFITQNYKPVADLDSFVIYRRE
jgi:hypothetical protein